MTRRQFFVALVVLFVGGVLGGTLSTRLMPGGAAWAQYDYDVPPADPGLPGVPGVGEKTAASLLRKFGDLPGILAAAADPGSDLAAGPRGKIGQAGDYLAVAPKVVAVARDLDLGSYDATLPHPPADPERLVELSAPWGLDSPLARRVDAVTAAAEA